MKDQVVLVTGANGGLGKYVTEGLLGGWSHGCRSFPKDPAI